MMHQNQNKKTIHEPVLLSEVLQYLAPRKGQSYLDLTAGYGGHAASVLAQTEALNRATLVDRDKNAVDYLGQKFFEAGVTIRHEDFLTASRDLLNKGQRFDMILADLGVSSPHLNEAHRGFSINLDGPLDMRMDETSSLTAADIVNSYSEAELAGIISRYGEEPKATKIANMIVASRPLKTTGELAKIVSQAWPGRSKIHPATRTFQALRIAVNNELDLLEKSLPIWIELLNKDGRIVVISFHSLEDKIVKHVFADNCGDRYDAVLALLTKHPVTAGRNETAFNPRARSAKLRAAAKK